jgi:uncharacterized protein with ParB-like and HNH nuclease domain
MSKLNIEQKTICELLSDKKADFLIPDYQRPYAWGFDECTTLWDDIFSFAFPNSSYEGFDSDSDEYFLGSIVTFKNEKGKQEVIDGQQRLTTLMLLLRAFYEKFLYMKDKNSLAIRDLLAKSIWKTTEFGEPKLDQLKIDSEVASEEHKEEFLEILRKGTVQDSWKSPYAVNYRFFQNKINEMVDRYSSYTAYLATRILNNVILLPIEADSQKMALQIFATLNDRGLPLSDADIFKSQFYHYFSQLGKKKEFVSRWKRLEQLTQKSISSRIAPLDELFARLMYFHRAKEGIKDTTTISLRDFFSRKDYELLKREETLEELEHLAEFWNSVEVQGDCFSERVLKKLFVLHHAPNSMWIYFLSVYFLTNRNERNELEEESLCRFLSQLTVFVLAYGVERPGVNALRSPIYPEMISVVKKMPVTFEKYKFHEEELRTRIRSYVFTNNRQITKSMLVWWAFQNPEQKLMDIDEAVEIEHIYARRRTADQPLEKASNLEALGNKSILEKRINIRAADYRFADKKKYYNGYTNSGGRTKEKTKIHELLALSREKDDWTEADIEFRTERIIDTLIAHLKAENLIAESDNDVKQETARLYCILTSNGLAKALWTEDGMTVLKGSYIRKDEVPSCDKSISEKRAQFNKDEPLAEDVHFSSPSTAAGFVVGRSSNGWLEWKTLDGTKTMMEAENRSPETTEPEGL